MAGERNYLRVPPDSTGKALSIKHQLKLYYTDKDINHAWDNDGEYSLSISGLVFIVHDWYEATVTSGYLMVSLTDDDRDSNVDPQKGETITHVVDGDPVANVSQATVAWDDIYTNQTVIVGGHPERELEIDQAGAANVRFAEGAPQLDAFGKLRVSQSTTLGDYSFSSSILSQEFSTTKVGGNANAMWDATRRGLKLTLEPDVSSYSTFGYSHQGMITHTSNTYHHYTPGVGQTYLATVSLGDIGKDNLWRSWGFQDAWDGVFFKMEGTTLGVCIRSSVSGSVVENFIPQSLWNADKLDGTGVSKFTLDVTKDNIYWIDYQWLGAGSVRFGVFHKGKRIVCHTEHHDGTLAVPYMRTGALPVCQNQIAIGGTIPSTSEMWVWCIGVFADADIMIRENGRNGITSLHQTISDPTSQYYFVGAIMAEELSKNGIDYNRSLYYPTYVDILALDELGEPVAGELEFYIEPVITGGTWSTVDVFNSTSTMLQNVDPTTTYVQGSGVHLGIEYVPTTGFRELDFTETFESVVSGSFKNYSCKGGVKTQPLVSISNTNPAVVTVAGGAHVFRDKGEPVEFSGVTGMTEINGQSLYMKFTGADTAELYTDASFTTSYDASLLTAGTGGSIKGFFGTQFVMGAVWKPFTKTGAGKTHDIRVRLSWKEVNQ